MLVRPLRQGIRRLSGRDHWEVVRFLEPNAAQNAYLLGQVARGGLHRESVAGIFAGHWEQGTLTGVLCIGSNLVLSWPCNPAAIDAFATFSHDTGYAVRVVVGPDPLIAAFMERFRCTPQNIRLERPDQRLFAVTRGQLCGPAEPVELRPADVTELEVMVRTDLAMVNEELGFDPFSAEIGSFRRGWLRRIRELRSWVVGPVGGPIVFKLDHSAVSDAVVQIAGVYTAPAYRRRGVARRAIHAMCVLLFEEVEVVSLYVHQQNTAAIGLYRALGFEEVGAIRSVWMA
ncbi:MAG: ribosomal protein S18 acetylase RimI-like enzyme [Myxococcota bacterium]